MIWFTGFLFLEYCLKVLCQCNGTALSLTASEVPQGFQSPGYPSAYSNNLYCQWLIDSGDSAQTILLYGSDMYLDCALGDTITIFDGSTDIHALLVLNLCSAGPTVEYLSTGQYVLVTFSSDASNTDQGFEFTYISAADTSGTGCSAELTLSASETPQYLTSQGFPSQYSGGSDCRWLITASTKLSTLNITLVFSDIEFDSVCDYDVLTIYNGGTECEDVLLTDCSSRTNAGDTPTMYITAAERALVVFSSDGSLNKYGFVIQYSETLVPVTTTTTTTTTIAPTTTTTAGTTTTTTSLDTTTLKQSSSTETDKSVDYPLLIASGVGGAGSVLLVLAIYHLIKYISSMKKQKKGLMKVKSIAPLPARTVFNPRQPPHTLSFV